MRTPVIRVEVYSLANLVGFYGPIFTLRDHQPDRVLLTTRSYDTADAVARDQEAMPRPDATVTDGPHQPGRCWPGLFLSQESS